jgi:hypothetical protein
MTVTVARPGTPGSFSAGGASRTSASIPARASSSAAQQYFGGRWNLTSSRHHS